MKINVTLTPQEIQFLPEMDLATTTCVVFDVLRATSTMVTALAHGAAGVVPVRDIGEALAVREQHPDALLGGERQGERIEGFHLGNSPLEYRALAGERIISTTTNGTIALRACDGAREVLAASLLNIGATAEYLRGSGATRVRLVCAGTGKHFALEDAIGAGALLECLEGEEVADAGWAVREIWKKTAADVFSGLASAKNGARLIRMGRRAEVEWCAVLDKFPMVARMQEGELIRVT